MAKAATLRSAPAIEVAMLRSGRVLQRSKNRFDSPMAPESNITPPAKHNILLGQLLQDGRGMPQKVSQGSNVSTHGRDVISSIADVYAASACPTCRTPHLR